MIITDKDGKIIAVKRSARKLGFCDGMNIRDYLPADTTEIERNGRTYEVRTSESGDFKIYILRDITKRKEVEKKLKESEQMYRTLVELSPDAIVVHDGQRIVFANKRAAELSGFDKPEDMVGLPVLDFIHPDYVDLVRERVIKMIRNETIAPPIEEKFVLPNGSVRDVEASASFITFNGRPAILLVVRDISEKKRMEEEIVESERQYRDFFRNSLDMIVVTDLEGNFVEVNREFEKLSG